MSIILWVILALVVVIVAWLVLGYNSFVRLINQTKEAWADIDVQLKRRYDLIPNLIETVKGYATHESSVFEKVTEARANALSAQGPAEKGKAENMLTDSLKSVFAVAEAYPALRAVESFTSLQTELADTENKIQAARRFYNGNVRDLNIKVETFPSNLIAKTFKFTKREFFQLEEGSVAKEPVAVKF
jgi:LemA protein